jgi:hypothetical protein
LTLYWYDSQGCIAANTINIVAQLPLLVVMIKIFQDFPLGMWGYTPVDIWTKDGKGVTVPYERKENPVGSFQITGRRTFTADANRSKPTSTSMNATTLRRSNRNSKSKVEPQTAEPQTSSSNDEHSRENLRKDEVSQDILFLKSAWPEMARRKEPEVIMEAYKRANELLGTEAPSLTDHLPVVINFQELAYTSTKIIRCLIKSTTKDGFRVQLWMLSMKLLAIHSLDPVDFWRAFWQTLQCELSLFFIHYAFL